MIYCARGGYNFYFISRHHGCLSGNSQVFLSFFIFIILISYLLIILLYSYYHSCYSFYVLSILLHARSVPTCRVGVILGIASLVEELTLVISMAILLICAMLKRVTFL